MREINILESFPKTKRIVEKGWRTEENKQLAKLYDREFFDGERVNGYGGYYYDGRWRAVVKKLQETYNLHSKSSVLDIGCGKGFLLFDLQDMIPGIKIAGLDISKYALNKAMDGYANYLIKQGVGYLKALELEEEARKKILPFLIQGSAENLPYIDNSFDLVISIDTIHNLPEDKCRKALREIIRVNKNKKNMFIKMDSYRNQEEKERMENWILTAETFLSENQWLELFKQENYNGDYFWTIV